MPPNYKKYDIHTDIDDDVADKVVKNFRLHLTVDVTAKASRVHPKKLNEWLKQGEKDWYEGKQTPNCRLVMDAYHAQSVNALELLAKLKECPKNWQAASWLLEKAFPEDFGVDTAVIKEIKETQQYILDNLTTWTE